MNIRAPTPAPADFIAAKARQQRAWSSGDHAIFGGTLQIVGEMLCAAVDLRSSQLVLDVDVGNATLPFADASFDVVLSTFGVMFTPHQQQAADEMMRVCRPGGKIGLANWTPESFIGQLFRTIGRHLPPPAGVPSPVLWGTRAHLDKMFASHGSVRARARHFAMRYESAEHWSETFRACYAPVVKAFEALDDEDGTALQADIDALLEKFNVARDGTLEIPSEYLEVVITKRK